MAYNVRRTLKVPRTCAVSIKNNGFIQFSNENRYKSVKIRKICG